MKTLPFLKSYRDALNRIPDPAIRWKALEYLQDYAIDGAYPDEDIIRDECGVHSVAVLIALDLIRPLIDKKKAAEEAHREAGKAGGRPANKPKKTKDNQTKPISMEVEVDIGNRKMEKDKLSAAADDVLEALNDCAGKHFRPIDGNRKYIIARMREGYTKEDCLAVVQKMSAKWGNTDMADYLRPKTLFSASNFDGYLNSPDPGGGRLPDGQRIINPSAHNFDERSTDYDCILRQEEAERLARQEVTG